ncbi:hypothetical protein P7K49_031298 [Saguinus oedipus]|uniref:Uncharacterized protein n=1 Tax=Saguinus oedipus TaxID=9490 RepID=A0ABQ9TYZ4_SAGOE|nr:hypothetical protein P7K49_031298 [Saguinus oedipus]
MRDYEALWWVGQVQCDGGPSRPSHSPGSLQGANLEGRLLSLAGRSEPSPAHADHTITSLASLSAPLASSQVGPKKDRLFLAGFKEWGDTTGTQSDSVTQRTGDHSERRELKASHRTRRGMGMAGAKIPLTDEATDWREGKLSETWHSPRLQNPSALGGIVPQQTDPGPLHFAGDH